MEDEYKVLSREYDMLTLFIGFSNGIPKKGVFDYKIHGGEYWSNLKQSIQGKYSGLQILAKEVNTQIQNLSLDNEEMEKFGYSKGTQREILLVKYKAFLNEIYSLCENLALLGYAIVPEVVNPLYHDQLKYFKKNSSKSPQYSQILLDNEWYSDMHIIRSENTHYLDGFSYRNEDGKVGILYRKMINRREGVTIETEIDKPDIIEHIDELMAGINKYITNLLNFLFTYIDGKEFFLDHCWMKKETETAFKVFGPRRISFKDFKEKRSWECITSFPCLLADNCPYTQIKVKRE